MSDCASAGLEDSRTPGNATRHAVTEEDTTPGSYLPLACTLLHHPKDESRLVEPTRRVNVPISVGGETASAEGIRA